MTERLNKASSLQVMDLSLIEQLSFSTVRIEASSDTSISCRTGFFYAIRLESQHIPLITTNKHVVKDNHTARLRFTLKNEDGRPNYSNHYDLRITDFEDAWPDHPDPDVDLCAMPMAELFKLAVETSSSEPFYIPLDTKIIPTPSDIDQMLETD